MAACAEPVQITILHFNDVYNIEPQTQEPVGGAARFKTALASRAALDPLVLFSGDAFNPSVMSTVTKGKQMLDVLNELNVHCAVYGNHDFDHGVDNLVELARQSTFPWLLSNVEDEMSNKPLAEGKISHIIEWKGKKLGLLGLVEEEWIATLSTLDPEEVNFLDYVNEGRKLATDLRNQGCDYIIALTHMRWPNDIKLAEGVPEIDLILGGHDHDYAVKKYNNKFVVKSGTDFRQMCQVTLTFGNNNEVTVDTEEVTIDSSIAEDPIVRAMVDKYTAEMGEQMEKVLGHLDVELDGRFCKIRTQETNLGNLMADIMLLTTDANVALLNSGTLRSDRIHRRGVFRVKDLMSVLPMVDPLVVVELTGSQIVEALENGVSQFPKLEGRFPQVSGISFGFNPDRPPGRRVDPRFVMIEGKYLKLDSVYRVCTKHYVAEGKDGYNVFKLGKVVLNDEQGPRLSTSVQNHFESLEILQGHQICKSQHRQSLISLHKKRSLSRQLSVDEDGELRRPSHTSRTSLSTSLSAKRLLLRKRSSLQTLEESSMPGMLAPKVEGRIFILDDKKFRQLEENRLAHDVQRSTIVETEEPAPS